MTSEELNRAMEFIIASQSRLSAAQEQDRADRLAAQDERVAFENWSKGITSQVVQVLDLQSPRLDRQERFYDESEAFQRQALHLLNLILDRLPPAPAHEAT
jgi:hypothetical protein